MFCFNLSYFFVFMFEQFHVNVWKLSRLEKTSHMVFHHFDLKHGLVFLDVFYDGNEAEEASLCYLFTHGLTSVGDLSRQGGNGGSFMVHFGTYTSQKEKVGGGMQALVEDSHLFLV